jgi:hypothetical protein
VVVTVVVVAVHTAEETARPYDAASGAPDGTMVLVSERTAVIARSVGAYSIIAGGKSAVGKRR